MDLEIFECISEVLDEYESKKDIYKLIAEEVKDFFEKNVFSESKHELSLIYRVKSAASIREKMIRNNYDIQKNEAEKILARMQDIIGLRIECKFIEEEKYAYALLRQLFSKTEDQAYYYMSSMPRIRLKLSEKQPQLQKNGFKIYKIDGYFMMGKESVAFELQIKALVNSFWSEIEHRVVYKNRDYMLSDNFVADLFTSIKESLNTLDSQLYLLYRRFRQEGDEVQDEALVERQRERSVEIFIANMVYKTFDRWILEQLGFSVDFKASCDAIIRYFMEREHANEMEDYGRMMMRIFNRLDCAEEHLQLTEQITFTRKMEYLDAFTQRLGSLIEEMINKNFRWHLYFAILFAMEEKPKEQVLEEFVVFFRNAILENRMLAALDTLGEGARRQIFDDLLDTIAGVLYRERKIEFLCADGMRRIHKGLNHLLPTLRNDLSHGVSWERQKAQYIERFASEIGF